MTYLVVIVPPEDVNGDARVDEIARAIEKILSEYGIDVQIEVVK